MVAKAESKEPHQYPNYPTYQQVKEYILEKYTIDFIDDNEYLGIAKKPEGWFLTFFTYNNEREPVKLIKIWDSNKEKYVKADLNKLNEGESNNEAKLAGCFNEEQRLYTENYYFGYSGYYNDVIEKFDPTYSKAQFLAPNYLNALGRAYSAKATGYLNNNFGFAKKEEAFYTPEDITESLSLQSLEVYRKTRRKAIAVYETLEELDPDFKVIVGAITTKIDNEYMTAYLDVLQYWGADAAMQEIEYSLDKRALYQGFHTTMAKNYLNSCPYMSVLFTVGDNDTYPLLFVQAAYSIRTDVRVVNLSLLQTPKYLASLQKPLFSHKGIETSLSLEDFNNGRLDFVYLNQQKPSRTSIENLLKVVKSDNPSFMVTTMADTKIHYLPVKEITLPYKGDTMSVQFTRQYLFRSDLLVYDILSNKSNGAICFVSTMSTESMRGLENHLKLRGLAYELAPKQAVDSYSVYDGYIDTKLLYDILINVFDYTSLDTAPKAEKVAVENQRILYSRLINELIEEGSLDSAKMALDFCINNITEKAAYYAIPTLGLADAYFKVGERAKAVVLIDTILENIKEERYNRAFESKREMDAYKSMVNRRIDVLKEEYEF